MLGFYLELARTHHSLPVGASRVIRRLYGRPGDYSPQLLRLLPLMVESHPHLADACRVHGVDPAGLVAALKKLAPHEVLAVLDDVLRLRPEPQP
jgi:hypothetical protein